jgi:transposase-like protein
MRKSKFTEIQIRKILAEVASGAKATEVCAKHKISVPTLYLWKSKHRSNQNISTSESTQRSEPAAALDHKKHQDREQEPSSGVAALKQQIIYLEDENDLLRRLFINLSLERVSSKFSRSNDPGKSNVA